MKSLSILILSSFIFISPVAQNNDKLKPIADVSSSNTNLLLSPKKLHDKNVSRNWKLSVALYAFQTFSFPKQQKLADSAGLKYVERPSFASAGPNSKIQ
jgi:hypothetical protein